MTITYSEVRNPKYITDDGTKIWCEVQFPHLEEGWHPFIADANDVEPHGREIFELAKSGAFGKVSEYVSVVVPEKTPEEKLARIGLTKEDLKALVR